MNELPFTDPLTREALLLLEGTNHDGRVMALTAIRWALKDHRPLQIQPCQVISLTARRGTCNGDLKE